MRQLIPLLLACCLGAAESAPHSLLPASAANLDGIELVDQTGAMHRLGDEGRGRLVMLFQVDQRFEAKRCDAALTRRLGAAAPLVRIIDASGTSAEDRPILSRRVAEAVGAGPERFLLDWDGSVRKRLGLAEAGLVLIGISGTGTVAGALEGQAEAAPLAAALRLVGRAVDPPFDAAEFARVRKGR